MCAFEPADQSLKNRLYGKHLDSTNPKVAFLGGGNLGLLLPDSRVHKHIMDVYFTLVPDGILLPHGAI